MAVTLELFGDQATIEGQKFSSNDQQLADMLNSFVPLIMMDYTYSPDIDRTIADAILAKFPHAKLIHADPPPAAPQYDEQGRPLIY